MRALTQRQENYCLNLLKGLTQRESWIQAGYSSKYAVAIIDRNACYLANSNKIKTRLAELRKPAENAVIAPRDELGEIYTQAVRNSETTIRDKVLVGREISQLYGYYDQPPTHDIVQTFVFVLPDGTKLQPKQLRAPVIIKEGE